MKTDNGKQKTGNVVTRFAPSPTGFLHIGGARTALFNWLFSKRHGGKFLLRIEDTDKKRSTKEAIDAILKGMDWLELYLDGEVVFQSKQEQRHKELAHELLEQGHAYHCYCSTEELTQMREEAQKQNKPFRYDGRWRDRDPSEAPAGIQPVIRLKTPLEGETVVNDVVQGKVTFPNTELDDLILLRSDGTPTYMLAVVMDDHDMGITHVIRGDDHLNNAAKQQVIYEAMGWDVPKFAHIPLIHGADGAKLSKRHGALGVEEYRDMGYLPEAMRNYLLRLGWSHGDDEVISTAQAIEWFDLEHIGKSPSRFDFNKLNNLNGIYIREADNQRLVELIVPFIKNHPDYNLVVLKLDFLLKLMPELKKRAKNLKELADSAVNHLIDDITTKLYANSNAQTILEQSGQILDQIAPELETLNNWNAESLEGFCRTFGENRQKKLGDIAQPLRVAMTGNTVSISIFTYMEILGKDLALSRLDRVLEIMHQNNK